VKKILYLVLGLAITVSVGFAQEALDTDKPSARLKVTPYFEVSTGDVFNRPGCVLAPGIDISFYNTGLAVGTQWIYNAIPSGTPGSFSKNGEYILYEEYSTDIVKNTLGLTIGNKNVFHANNPVTVDGQAYAIGELNVGGVEVARLRLNVGYLDDSVKQFSLGIVPRLGYKLDVTNRSSASIWIEFATGLYPTFALKSIDASCSYALKFGAFSITPELRPSFVLGDAQRFALNPVLTVSYSF
jgi:hypothetical protein